MSTFELNWENDPQPHCARYFRSETDRDNVLALVRKYDSEGELLGAGRHRAGFLVGGMIIKVGLSDGGIAACFDEVSAYEHIRFTYPVAECCMFDDYSELMEPIERLSSSEAEDVCVRWRALGHMVGSIDADSRGRQIGLTPDGRHVVFDFGEATYIAGSAALCTAHIIAQAVMAPHAAVAIAGPQTALALVRLLSRAMVAATNPATLARLLARLARAQDARTPHAACLRLYGVAASYALPKLPTMCALLYNLRA